ncbi:MAG: DUF3341 domain-containing protein [Gemmataceae bacterium]|nr:DUF3341 domain-containing protein [Gemmataceae bacterium]
MNAPTTVPTLYGLVAEFDGEKPLIHAIETMREAGYRSMDAYTPYPSHAVSDALDFKTSRLPLIVLIGGIVGGLTGFGMQYYFMAIDYPHNVGGRPLNSWPMWIPVTFELTILFAAFSAVLGMLALNGLPMPYHPLFNVERFALASRDRFFLCIESTDPKFDLVETRRHLLAAHAKEVSDVEN